MNKNIVFTDWDECNTKIYGCSFDSNYICEIDKANGKSRKLYSFKDLKLNSIGLTGRVICANSTIVFTPLNANEIILYDTINQNITSLSFSDLVSTNTIYDNDKMLFCDAIFDGISNIYMFGFGIPNVIKLNLNDKSIVNIDVFSKKADDLTTKLQKKAKRFFGRCVQKDNCTYLISGVKNSIWKIDSNNNIELINISDGLEYYRSIAVYNNGLLLTGDSENDNTIVLWDNKTNKCSKISLSDCSLWHNTIVYKNDIYLFPSSAKSHILHINGTDFSCKRYKELDDLLMDNNSISSAVLAVKCYGSKVTFIRAYDSCWFSYDFESRELTKAFYEVDNDFWELCKQEVIDEQFENNIKNNEMFHEENISLKDYIIRI